MKKEEVHLFQGMSRDIHQINQKNEFLWDALNIRFTVREDNTQMCITNERGPLAAVAEEDESEIDITGLYLGHCVIDDTCVVFTKTDTVSYIWEIVIEDASKLSARPLIASSFLDFGSYVEAIGLYGNQNLRKIYWVDGKNQPRVINIDDIPTNVNKHTFDFVPYLELNEKVSIVKNSNGGNFLCGVIQYCFTYYKKYAQETNVFYTSPLYYISPYDRGGAADENCANSFKITIDNIDKQFDYVRIYALHRTAKDTQPTLRRVVDIDISKSENTITYTDRGTEGDAIDPTHILYVGGEEVIAGTITSKSDTLFLGNIQLTRKSVNKLLKFDDETNYDGFDWGNIQIDCTLNTIQHYEPDEISKVYPYKSTLNSEYCAGFKSQENYRLGFQLQHKTGKWSEPVYIGDYTQTKKPVQTTNQDNSVDIGVPIFRMRNPLNQIFSQQDLERLQNEGYIKIRPVCVFPTFDKRRVITQGIANATVFSITNRDNKSPSNQASWVFRPFGRYIRQVTVNDETTNEVLPTVVGTSGISEGSKGGGARTYNPYTVRRTVTGVYPFAGDSERTDTADPLNVYERSNVEFRHGYSLISNSSNATEIQCSLGAYFYNLFNTYDDSVSPPVIDLSKIDANGWPAGSSIYGLEYNDNSSNVSVVEWEDEEAYASGTSLWDDGGESSSSGHNSGSTGGFGTGGGEGEGGTQVTHGTPIDNRYIGKFLAMGYNRENYSNFFVDNNTITINSPEVLYDSNFSKKDYSNSLILNCVGYIPFTKCLSDLSIDIKNSTFRVQNGGFRKNLKGQDTPCIIGTVNSMFKDDMVHDYEVSGSGNKIKKLCAVRFGQVIPDSDDMLNGVQTDATVYMWHRTGSLTNDFNTEDPPHSTYSLLDTKKISNLRISLGTEYFSDNSRYGFQKFGNTLRLQAWEVFKDSHEQSYDTASANFKNTINAKLNIFDQLYVAAVKFKNDNLYYGNVDTLIIPSYSYSFHASQRGMFGGAALTNNYEVLRAVDYICATNSGYAFKDPYYWTMSPVRMSYKSSFHLIANIETPSDDDGEPGVYGITDFMPDDKDGRTYLWMLDVLDPTIDEVNDYDYTYNTTDAYLQDIWVPCGEALSLVDENDLLSKLEWSRGDTWYQRFDCLKTYPYNQDAENCLVDIASFMVETRINIDGRYDKQRGQTNNLFADPTNYGLVNMVYSQLDNFFTYQVLPDDFYKLNDFRNTITWTLEHQTSAIVDTWTDVTMASVWDLDGSKGDLVRLINHNDTLLGFQENAIVQILYDERTQIPVADGVPIEIGNNKKVSGVRYFSDTMGCRHRDSIVKSPVCVYFIESVSNNLNKIAKDGIEPVSIPKGLSQWFTTAKEVIRCMYDLKYNDLYIMRKGAANNKKCLVYSELLGAFTSFMSYDDVAAIFNGHGQTLCLHQEYLAQNHLVARCYRMFVGQYNNFFGEYKDYYITFISNENQNIYKTFTNITLVDDIFTETDNPSIPPINDTPFTYIRAWNEYQDTGIQKLQYDAYEPSITKRKFRIWGIQIPRDSLNGNGFDRISNTWTAIQLGSNVSGDGLYKQRKLRFHNLYVTYHMQ